MSLPRILRTSLRSHSARYVDAIYAAEHTAFRTQQCSLSRVRRRHSTRPASQQAENEDESGKDSVLVAWKPDTGPDNEPQIPRETMSRSTETPRDSDVPWYLQGASKTTAQNFLHPMADRQRIPELLDQSPPILEPLMKYISIDLGLDNLELLDLRGLDPPPALGTSLLMLIGSARSEKHLHVSADRCCRWLRSCYKLSPYADGLLGRNELKIKLRRKARRARIMSAVGASSTSSGEMDDGIRTGWVCVNIGQVEPAADAIVPEAPIDGFVGFGQPTHGVSIVVQMFTEEKRADVDLEGLWGGLLNRHSRRRAKMTEIDET